MPRAVSNILCVNYFDFFFFFSPVQLIVQIIIIIIDGARNTYGNRFVAYRKSIVQILDNSHERIRSFILDFDGGSSGNGGNIRYKTVRKYVV